MLLNTRLLLSRGYFFITTLGLAVFGILLLSFYYYPEVWAGDGSSGDPYTVCASGCDYTTINAALAAIGASQYIEIKNTYSTSTEVWPLSVADSDVVITCESTNVIIEPPSGEDQPSFNTGVNTSISGCSFVGSSDVAGDPTIATYLATGAQLSNNIITDFRFAVGTSTVFTNNTITVANASTTIFALSASDNVTITSNTINYTYEGAGLSKKVFGDDGSVNSLTVTSNTISIASSTNGISIFAILTGGTNMSIQGNKFKYSGGADYTGGTNLPATFYFRNSTGSSLTMSYNTFFITNFNILATNRSFLAVEDDTTGDTTPLYATSTYNVFYYDGTGTSTNARAFQFKTDVATSRMYENYNGYAGSMYSPAFSTDGAVAVAVTSGGSSQTTVGLSPLRNANVSTADDFILNPMSGFLDVNGTIDMGAVSATRGSSFVIDDNGTIDYSTVHATSTASIEYNVRTGDTWTLLAGTYSPFAIASSSLALSDVTIAGAGATTIINGVASTYYGVKATGFSDLTLQDFLVQNASSSQSTYTASHMIFTYNATSYDDTDLLEQDPNATLILNAASCSVAQYTADGYDITSITGATATDDWHLALVDFGGPKVTILVPDQYASSAAVLDGFCGSTTDVWVTSTFAVANGAYTYDSSAVTAAGVTLTGGYTSPPAISRTQTFGAGIRLSNTGAATILNVTSTANAHGIDISTSAGIVTVNSSTLQNSTQYDVYAVTTQSHIFNNVYFTVASSSFTGAGTVTAKYNTRAFVQNESATPLAGVAVNFVDTGANATTTVTTIAGGYTPFTGFLTAFVLSSGDTTVTSGGYNPYTVTATASSTYTASSTSSNLSSSNQLFTLTMAEEEAPSGPTAPSSIATSTVATSSITITWTDNSADETSFLFDYVQSTDVANFPGTTSSLASNTTSTSITGLIPNTPYLFRVAAVNNDGTSTYVTSSVIYTNPETPGTPSASVTNTSTLSVSWSGGSNPATTVYEVYNVTTDTVFATTTATTTSVTGLSVNTSYQFKIRAQYAENIAIYTSYSSDSSGVYTLANPASAPTVVASSATVLSITINVNGNSSATTYAIYNSTSGNYIAANGASNGATPVYQTTSTWDNISAIGLTPNTSYQFTMTARNGDSVSASASSASTATYTNAAIPGTPSISASDVSTLSVSWSANSNANGTVYELYNVTDNASVVTTTETSYSVTGLDVNTQYQFKVRAQYLADNSTYSSYSSNASGVYTLANPASTPTVSAVSATALSITINANSNPSNTTYAIYNSTSGNYLAASGASNGATAVYQTVTVWDSPSATGLVPNTAYQFTITARNGDSVSAATSSANTAVYTDATAPGTPSATATGETTMSVSWSANSNGSGTVYELYNVTSDSVVATTTAVSYSVTGLTTNTSYQFKVRAQYLSDNSTYTSYSATSEAVSTSAAESVVETPAGAIFVPPPAPKLPRGIDAMNGALLINNNDVRVTKREVILTVATSDFVEYAISESTNFSNVSFVRFVSTKIPYTLSAGNGEKRVYVKLRTKEGGTITITDTIVLEESGAIVKDVPVVIVPIKKQTPVVYEQTLENGLSCTFSIIPTPTYSVSYVKQNNPESVKMVERFLNTYESANLSVNGVYEKGDRDAVIRWQEKYASEVLTPWGLTEGTGYVYTTTLKKMKEIHDRACQSVVNTNVIPTVNVINNTTSLCLRTDQTLVFGHINDSVKIAQQMLAQLGFFAHDATGFYGPITVASVRSFQLAHGIDQLGIIGPTTRATLNKLTCNQ